MKQLKFFKILFIICLFLTLIFCDSKEAEAEAEAETDVQTELKPLMHYAIFLDKSIASATDKTSYQSISYEGQDSRNIYDGRIDQEVTVSVFVYKVDFDDNISMEILVNPEFATSEDAKEQATKYAKIMGILPNVLRLNVNTLVIHKGSDFVESKGNAIIVYSDSQLDEYQILEEAILFQACKISLNPTHALKTDWIKAQKADASFVSSEDAQKYPETMDVPASFLCYFGLKYHSERMNEVMKNKIKARIENRIKYFDNQNFNMHPQSN